MREEFSPSNPLVSFMVDEAAPHFSAEPSILSEYVFFPFYDTVVRFIPSTVSPNSITLFGICCTLAASLLSLSSMPAQTVFQPPYASVLPTYRAEPSDNVLGPLYPTQVTPTISCLSPSVLLFICGVLNLMYCMADNADGRVARRDHRTSVIGEYLDHSLDCVTSLLTTGVIFCVMGASTANMAVTVVSVALVTVLAHTLHYETNRFVWGNRFVSVDEAMVLFAVAFWVPLVDPAFAFHLFPPSVVALFGSSAAGVLKGLRIIDVLYSAQLLSQLSAALGIVKLQHSIFLRFQVLVLIVCGGLFLLLIPAHTEAAAAAGGSNLWTLYTVGPFAYPAVWVITVACSCSTLIHITIVARCAHLGHMNCMPVALVVVTLLMFVSCPSLAMVWAAGSHLVQILCNIQLIYRRSSEREAKVKKVK